MSTADTRDRLRLPRPDRIPNASNERTVPELDTGGAFRPDWRKQSPSSDPTEPYGGESSGTGDDHGWSNCTMTAAALAYAYATGDQSGPWGGDLRHHQDDLSGGTDLYDADTAFHRLGNQNLDVLIGEGWAALKAKRAEGRAIIVQGEGNVPGSESFDGGHACVIGLETASDGKWLFGDPLASGWQWVTEASIRDWAENLSSGIYFAATAVAPPEEESVQAPELPLPDGVPAVADVREGTVLYKDSDLTAVYGSLGADRTLPVVGKIPGFGEGHWVVVHNNVAHYIEDAAFMGPFRPAETSSPDVLERDEEWREWLLEGSPGSDV